MTVAYASKRIDLGELFSRSFFAIYCACLFGANAVLLIPHGEASEGSGSLLFAVSWMVLSAVGVLLALFTLNQNRATLVFTLSVGLFLAISASWSVVPFTTLVYGALLFVNILVAHVMATRFGLRALVAMIGRTLLWVCLIGLLLYFVGFEPTFYIDVHERGNLLGKQPFRGLFAHKITAGMYASIGIAWSICTLDGLKRVSAVAVFVLVIVLSGSSTGIVLALVALLVSVFAVSASRARVSRTSIVLLVISLAGLISLLVVPNWTAGLSALGRDPSLTGRTDLWRLGLTAISERPFFGWGFSAYVESPQAVQLRSQVAAFANYEFPHFHQSWIQTAVDFGVGASLLLAFIVFRVVARSYQYAVEVDARSGSMAFASLIVIVVASLVMFVVVTYNHFITFFVFLLLFRFWGESGRRTSPARV